MEIYVYPITGKSKLISFLTNAINMYFEYVTTISEQIFYIDSLQKARCLINYKTRTLLRNEWESLPTKV